MNTFTANQNFDSGLTVKGPDPYADIRRYGKFGTFSNTTANTTSGSASVALTSAQSFLNGEYVTVYNAGAANAISAMSTVTLTPSSNAGGLNTVATGAGTTSFGYKVVAADKFGGYTAAGAEVSTTTGNALGVQTVAISTMSRSGRTVTVTTSAAHPFVVGSMIYIQYTQGGGTNTDNTFNGFFIVKTVADNTHLTFDQGFDTAAGATASDTGGTVIGFNCNHLSWTAVTGAWKYYIYGRTKGGPWNLLGQTMLTYFDDYGSPMNDNRAFPTYIPTTAPSSGANDHLTARISAGGGTTTLTLATNAGAALTGTGIVSDDGPAIIAAMQAGLPLAYIPAAGATVSSYTALPSNGSKLLLGGTITLRDTIEVHGSTIEGWIGASGSSGAWEGTPALQGSLAYPMLTAQFGTTVLKRVSLSCTGSNGCLDYYNTGTTEDSFDYVNWSTGNGNTTDYLGMHALFISGGFSYRFDKCLFSTGSPGTNNSNSIGQSPIPSVVFTPTSGGIATGNWAVTRTWFIGRGSFDQDWQNSGGGIAWNLAKDIQMQNGFLPTFMVTGNAAPNSMWDFEDLTPADFPTAILANLKSPSTTEAGLFMRGATANASTTGNLFLNSLLVNVSLPGQNRDYANPSVGLFPNLNVLTNNAGNMGYQLSKPAAPSLAASAGGSVPTGAHTYTVTALDPNGNESVYGFGSAITVNSGNQTVTITPPSAPAGSVTYKPYRDGQFVSSNCPCPWGTNVVDTAGFTNGPPINSAGVSSGLNSANINTPQLVLAQTGGFKNTVSGAFTANRTMTMPDASVVFPNVAGTIPTSGYQNSAYDNFNRANGGLGSNWTAAFGTVQISSNTAIATVLGGGNASVIWATGANFASNQFAQAMVSALNAGSDFVGPSVRYTASGNGYTCIESNASLQLQRDDANVRTTLTTSSTTGAVSDVLRIEANGSTITCTRTSAGGVVTAISATDTTYTSGSPGLFFYGTVATLKNWSGGNLHSIGQLDAEQDWTQPQHFLQGGFHSGTETFSNLNGDVYFDGTKNTTIQAAINACANPGTRVVVPPGSYTLTTGLTSNCQNLDFEGVGGTGDEISSGTASTVCPVTISVPSGQVGFTFNPTGASTNFRGPTIRNICFVGQSGATGGIRILRTNNFLLDHVGASYFSGSGAYGIFSDGTGNSNQYGVITNSQLLGDNIGIKALLNQGLRVAFNHFDSTANTGVPAAGTKGLYINCPASSQSTTQMVFGNVFEGNDVLIDSECGINDMYYANRFEGFITAAIRLQLLNSNQASGAQISGGSIANNINGSVGTGIIVGTGVSNSSIDMKNVAGLATVITDNGTNTAYYINSNGVATPAGLTIPLGGFIQFGTGDGNSIQRIASGRIKVTNNLEVNGVVTGPGVTTLSITPSFSVNETTAPSASANNDVCYGDSTAHAIKCSYNNGTFFNQPQTIASGTATLGTSAIASNSCATTVTVAATGVATTDAISWSFNADPNGVTGYGAGTTGALSIWTFPTSGNVNFRVCNLTAGSITPGAATLNWRVTR